MSSNVSLDTFEQIDNYRMRLLMEQAAIIGKNPEHRTTPLASGTAARYWELGEKIRLLEVIGRIRLGLEP